MNIETTIVVEFGVETDYISLIQLDPVLNVTTNSDGEEVTKTSFEPTDIAYISAHFSSNVLINSVVSTDGNATEYLASAPRTETFTNLFASRDEDKPDTYTLPVVPTSVGITHLGRVGALNEALTSVQGVEYTADTANTPFLTEFTAGFSTRIFKLTPPSGLTLEDGETYTVHVVFYITVL